MAATTAGGVKALLEAAGLGLAVHRNAAPKGTALPYVTVQDEVALSPLADGAYDRQVTHNVREVVQVDVWQTWRTDAGKPAENYTLAGAVRRALHGGSLPPSPGRVYGCRVTGSVRLLEPDTNVVHHAITLTVDRSA